MVKIFIDMGITNEQINILTDDYISPLYYACYNRNYHLINLLLDSGVIVSTLHKHNFNGLIRLCYDKDYNVIRRLMQMGLNKNFFNMYNYVDKSWILLACINNIYDLSFS